MKSIIFLFCLFNLSVLCQTKQDSILEGATLLNLKQAKLDTYYKYNLTKDSYTLLKFKNGKVVDYSFNSLTKLHLKVDTFYYNDKSGFAIKLNDNPSNLLRISNSKDDTYLSILVTDTFTNKEYSNNYYLYYSNKQLQSVKSWNIKDNYYTIKKYNKDGTLDGETVRDDYDKLIEVTVYNKKGKLSFRRWTKDSITISELYDKAGNLMQKDTTNADLKFVGTVVQFFPNQNIKSKNIYINGVKDGISYLYYENGVVKSTETYILGKRIGKYIYYRKDGTIKREGLYK